ncbi:protein virC2 (plasmid) [Agrobacterium vitis]|uniref:VirC2 family conjugal transfer protein n=1 Tax=Agrobacterium vitis TaxID=373 RepID=UPI0015D86CD3|nr:VirC2 family conjugal transfer protein [Agrobacterium vitis]BCH62603.1 protein virC2 [Agrobacterium vitis]
MGIRKPSVSVTEAKRLARSRLEEPLSETALNAQPDGMSDAVTAAVPNATPSASPEIPVEIASREAVTRVEPPRIDRRKPEPAFAEPRCDEPKIQVFLSAPLPAAGISDAFDRLCRQYPANKALQMVLRRALDVYDTRLDNGSHLTAPNEYPIDNLSAITVVQTSRMMPVRLVEIARSYFDPLGFESTRAFGRKLACAALATFFEAETRRPR